MQPHFDYCCNDIDYCNISLLGYELPWEDAKFVYPNNMAPPVEISVEASNGASDYGNKFGEPVLAGFARSFGMMMPNGERREWVKPIMFSGGIGMIDGDGVTKLHPEKGENCFPFIPPLTKKTLRIFFYSIYLLVYQKHCLWRSSEVVTASYLGSENCWFEPLYLPLLSFFAYFEEN